MTPAITRMPYQPASLKGKLTCASNCPPTACSSPGAPTGQPVGAPAPQFLGAPAPQFHGPADFSGRAGNP